jgi:uncharacterized protein
MTSIGVRELRQRASEILRRVETGETIEVTDRGRPVAVLSPLPDRGPIERLRASGDLIPSAGDAVELSADGATYLDRSALVKLALREPGSEALPLHVGPLISSALVRIEVARALLPLGPRALGRGQEVLARVDLVRPNDRIVNTARTLLPADLRSLDAIHLATALQLGDDLGTIVTYDERMAAGARDLGLPVIEPV